MLLLVHYSSDAQSVELKRIEKYCLRLKLLLIL